MSTDTTEKAKANGNRATRRSKPKAPPLTAPKSYLSDQESAGQLVKWLKNIEAQKMDVDIVMWGNLHSPTDVMPGEQGEPTYRERKAAFAKQQENIRKGAPSKIVKLADEAFASES